MKREIACFVNRHGFRPKLVTTLVGNDPASVVYVNIKRKVAEELGFAAKVYQCDLASHTCRADILYVAAGNPEFITADMVKLGVVVIDIGSNRVPNRKGDVGDVQFESVKEVASYITPVPGGIGPMTVTMLMFNTLEAAKRQVAVRKVAK